jgi:putative antitoxin of VapBC-like toxin-antitoxin system
MLRHMRTSIELSDGLLERARRLAQKRGLTLRALVEEGLRRILADNDKAPAFRLQEVTFGEGGLAEDLSEADWERIRDLSYEGRGS